MGGKTSAEAFRAFAAQLITFNAFGHSLVEVCWTFNFPANLSRLDALLQHLSSGHSIHTIESREAWWLSAGIHQLSEALEELHEKHRPRL